MAEDLAAVRARIRGVRQLDAVIGAMRGIAAAHAQQSRALLPGFRAYADVVTQAIAQALRLRDDDVRRGTGVPAPRVSCSARSKGSLAGSQSMCWKRPAARGAGGRVPDRQPGPAAGRSHGIEPVWQSAMATQVGGIAGLCIRIAEALYERMATQRIGVVEVVFPAWTMGVGVGVTCRSLLPLDARRFGGVPRGMPPLTTLPPEELLASLAEEYVFASLCEAAMHAFVAENEARAAAMVRARGKVQDMLEGLTLSEHRVRQEAITAELVELAAAG